MFKQIVTPKNIQQLTIQLPEEFVGHRVEVIAFTTDDSYSIPEKEKRKYTLQELEEFYSRHSVDMSKIEKWNREDLYDR